MPSAIGSLTGTLPFPVCLDLRHSGLDFLLGNVGDVLLEFGDAGVGGLGASWSGCNRMVMVEHPAGSHFEGDMFALVFGEHRFEGFVEDVGLRISLSDVKWFGDRRIDCSFRSLFMLSLDVGLFNLGAPRKGVASGFIRAFGGDKELQKNDVGSGGWNDFVFYLGGDLFGKLGKNFGKFGPFFVGSRVLSETAQDYCVALFAPKFVPFRSFLCGGRWWEGLASGGGGCSEERASKRLRRFSILSTRCLVSSADVTARAAIFGFLCPPFVDVPCLCQVFQSVFRFGICCT